MGNLIKAVIFDLGNVLVDFDHMLAAKKIAFFTNKDPKEVFGLFFDSSLTGSFEEGKISPEDFFLEVKNMLKLKIGYEEFLPIWNEIFFFTDKNRGVYDLAGVLQKKYKIAVLSNINILHHNYLKKEFFIFSPFNRVLTSYELKARKPDPLIYKKTMDILGVSDPAEVFYTDDRPELIEAAGELGIKSFVFSEVEKLKINLIDSGIDIT